MAAKLLLDRLAVKAGDIVADTSDAAQGLLERLLKLRAAQTAAALLVGLLLSYGVLKTAPGLPAHGWAAAAIEFWLDASVHLSVLLGIYVATYIGWGNDREILSPSEVQVIGETLANRVQSLIRSPKLDGVLLENRENIEILQRTREEVWISRETGKSLFSGCRAQLRKMIKLKVRFKIVLTDPRSHGAAVTAFRKSNAQKYNFKERFDDAKDALSAVFQGTVSPKRLVEIRYAPFALPSTAIIADPGMRAGDAEILYNLIPHLGEPDGQRMSLRVTSKDSPLAAETMKREFLQTFRFSSKLLVMQAPADVWQLGLREMFPGFFKSIGPIDNDDERADFHIVHASEVFLIFFNEEKIADGDRYDVLYGEAHQAAKVLPYASADGEKWKVSFDNLIKLRSAMDAAILAGKVIFFANVGPIALGMGNRCVNPEISAAEVTHLPQENIEFFQANRDPDSHLMALSIAPVVEKLVDDTRSHLFMHFQSLDLARSAPIYSRLINHERTSLWASDALAEDLLLEVQASVKVVKHLRSSPGTTR